MGPVASGGLAAPGGLSEQDLSKDMLLLAAPRIEFRGRTVPALGGIPLLAKLGQGGMGAVYFGLHPRLLREVAVKVLPFHLADRLPVVVQRFMREAQIAARIQSPYLVGVLDVNQESGLHFLVMEYVRGLSAGAFLRQTSATAGRFGIPVAFALDICIGATEGLAAAHRKGVVHRDVKPDNIIIPYAEDAVSGDSRLAFACAKLMDLGLARSDEQGSSLTGSYDCMGTPGYMAPEQAMDAKHASKPADVFGMGATLYALLAGEAPFTGTALMRILKATTEQPHVPLQQLRAEVPAAVNELINRCLAKADADRFTDACALLQALQICRGALGSPATAQSAAIASIATLVRAPEQGLSITAARQVDSTLASPVPSPGSAEAQAERNAPQSTHVPAARSALADVAPAAPAARRRLWPWAAAVLALAAAGGGYGWFLVQEESVRTDIRQSVARVRQTSRDADSLNESIAALRALREKYSHRPEQDLLESSALLADLKDQLELLRSIATAKEQARDDARLDESIAALEQSETRHAARPSGNLAGLRTLLAELRNRKAAERPPVALSKDPKPTYVVPQPDPNQHVGTPGHVVPVQLPDPVPTTVNHGPKNDIPAQPKKDAERTTPPPVVTDPKKPSEPQEPASVRVAEAELAKAKAVQGEADRALQRTQELLKIGAATQQQLQQAETTAKTASADVDRAQEGLTEARKQAAPAQATVAKPAPPAPIAEPEEDSAEAKYRSAVELAGRLLLARRWTAAEAAFNEALALKKNDLAATQGLTQAQGGARDERYQEALQRGEQALLAKDWDEAEKAGKAALQEKPDDAAAAALLAKMRVGLSNGRYETAMQQAQEAIRKQDWTSARGAIQRAQQEHPDDAGAARLSAEVTLATQPKPPPAPPPVAPVSVPVTPVGRPAPPAPAFGPEKTYGAFHVYANRLQGVPLDKRGEVIAVAADLDPQQYAEALQGRKAWLRVNAGAKVRIEASGKWYSGPGGDWVTPDGRYDDGRETLKRFRAFKGPDNSYNIAMLVVYISEKEKCETADYERIAQAGHCWAYTGKPIEFVMPATGTLRLQQNRDGYYDVTQGSISVKLTVSEPAPAGKTTQTAP